jgi:3-hydroxymyristoyl/3-hydroxydecanoyl-(acyl carrier protein) dehydratase
MTAVGGHGLKIAVPHDHPAFAGHFPGQPLLPGVVLLSIALEAVLAEPALAPRLGPAPSLGAAKFLAPVRPGDELTLHLHDEPAGVRFELKLVERVAASGRWDVR